MVVVAEFVHLRQVRVGLVAGPHLRDEVLAQAQHVHPAGSRLERHLQNFFYVALPSGEFPHDFTSGG